MMDFSVSANCYNLAHIDYWDCSCGYKYRGRVSDVRLVEDFNALPESQHHKMGAFEHLGEFYQFVWESEDGEIDKDNYLCCPDCDALFQDNRDIRLRAIKEGHLPSPIII